MNVLLMALMYPDDQRDEVARNAKDKVQNQINNYQKAFVEGIRATLSEGEKLSILNSLPVGIFPLQYRQLFLKAGLHDDGTIEQLGCINLPLLKQKGRAIAAKRALLRWIEANPNNRTVLLYTQYLPYLEAVQYAKKKYPDLKAAVIVTDLPNDMGLASGRKGILKQIESILGNRSLTLCQAMDGFILLTEPMAEAIGIQHKPFVVIEGLIRANDPPATGEESNAVLYTGTLEPGLGISEMLQAFEHMPQTELWICGQGSMQQEVLTASQQFANIRYFGFVPQEKALALQAKAAALINPRSPEEAFTRYSFPSKTLEYLRSGKPVLCYKLEGIPNDYDPYLVYIKEKGHCGIEEAVKNLMSLPVQQRKQMGQDGRSYVLEKKNPQKQCERLVRLLRNL